MPRKNRVLMLPKQDRAEAHYIAIDDYNLVVMPVRKVAGTSIKETLKTVIERNRMRLVTLAEVAELYSDYFSFAFVRHPADRLVSFWHFVIARDEFRIHSSMSRLGFTPMMSFADTVRHAATIPDADADPHFRSQAALLCHQGEVVPQWVGRYEHLEDHWRVIQTHFAACGLEVPDLQHRNKTKTRQPWQTYYNDELYSVMADRYAEDLERWYSI